MSSSANIKRKTWNFVFEFVALWNGYIKNVGTLQMTGERGWHNMGLEEYVRICQLIGQLEETP